MANNTTNDGEYTGGSVNYYKVQVEAPVAGGEPYAAECLDIIEALGMTYAEASAFKGIWRECARRNLNLLKKGADDDGVYDAEKVVFFGEQMLRMAKNRRAKNAATGTTVEVLGLKLSNGILRGTDTQMHLDMDAKRDNGMLRQHEVITVKKEGGDSISYVHLTPDTDVYQVAGAGTTHLAVFGVTANGLRGAQYYAFTASSGWKNNGHWCIVKKPNGKCSLHLVADVQNGRVTCTN